MVATKCVEQCFLFWKAQKKILYIYKHRDTQNQLQVSVLWPPVMFRWSFPRLSTDCVSSVCLDTSVCVSMWLPVCFHCRWLPVKVRSLPHFRSIRQCGLTKRKKDEEFLWSRCHGDSLLLSPQAVCERCTKASVYFRKTKNKKISTCQGLGGQSLSTCAWENLVSVEMIHCLMRTISDSQSLPFQFVFDIFALRVGND